MKFAILPLVTLVLLTSCATANLGDSQTKALILPDVPEYTPAQQKEVADELLFLMANYKPRPTSLIFLKDYHVMQQETRAAISAIPAR